MRVTFFVNDRREPGAEQTTTLMMSAALRRGHRVFICGVGDFTQTESGKMVATGCVLEAGTPASLVSQLAAGGVSTEVLDEQDLCVVRTNPGRDGSRHALHIAALRLLERLEERGVRVINSPRGLSRALTKLSLLDLPQELRPQTLVTCDAAAVERFIAQQASRTVIKPLDGTRGRDVFMLEPGAQNAKQIIDVVLRQGYAVVQEFLAGADNGDVRVTVIDGEILEVEGQPAAVARVPSRDDFRSNLHAGGSAAPFSVTPEMHDAVARISSLLEGEGLFHVGVDFVGGQILELNVFSPGGLYPSERLYGHDFSEAVIEAFERRA